MVGKSRSVLYEELIPEFSHGSSSATVDNDADGDGHTDFEEYLAGTNPTKAVSFPVYRMTGEEIEDSQPILIPVLIAVCLAVIIVMMVVIIVSNGSINRDLEAARLKEAEEDKQVLQKMLSSGGKERLDNLLAAARGEARALPTPSGHQIAENLPSAEPTQAQPMEAQAMQAVSMNHYGDPDSVADNLE
jgi:hypothetical protein